MCKGFGCKCEGHVEIAIAFMEFEVDAAFDCFFQKGAFVSPYGTITTRK